MVIIIMHLRKYFLSKYFRFDRANILGKIMLVVNPLEEGRCMKKIDISYNIVS